MRHIPWQGYCFLFLHGPPTMTWHDQQCYTRMRWNKLMGWAMLSHKTRTKETQEYEFVGLALLWCTVCFHNLSWKVYDYFSPITSLPVCRVFRKGLTEKTLLIKLNLWDKYCSDGQSIFILSILDRLTSHILTSLQKRDAFWRGWAEIIWWASLTS